MKEILVVELQPEMVIVDIGQQIGNINLRNKNVPFSDALSQWLMKMGVQSVWVESQPASTEVTVSNSQMLLNEAKQETPPRSPSNNSQSLYLGANTQASRSLIVYWQHYQRAAMFAGFGLLIGYLFATGWSTFGVYQSQIMAWVQPSPEPKDETSAEQQPIVEVAMDDMTEQRNTDVPAQGAVVAENSVISNLNTEPQLMISAQQQVQPISTTAETEIAPIEDVDDSTDLKTEQNNSDPVISDALLAKFSEAIEAVDEQGAKPATSMLNTTDLNALPRIDQIPPRVLAKIPPLEYSVHMYASENSKRWITLNGLVHREGDLLEDSLTLVEIAPQHIVLSFQGYDFTLRALTDW